MSKRLLNLRELFSNTKFLIVFSIVLALIFWIVVAIEYTPIIQSVVEDVPVVIDMEGSAPERLGLKPFGGENLTVNITIEGKRYDVGGKKVTAEDFKVEAETAYIDSAGEKALAIKAVPLNANAEFEIIELSSDYVNVFFDREATKEISLTPKIHTATGSVAAEGYEFYEEEVSVEKTITVSGPKTEIDKIKEAFLEINLTEPLSVSKVVEGSIVFDTGTSDEARFLKVDGESADSIKIAATIPVYKIQTLPVGVSFTHAPKAYLDNPLNFVAKPATVNVAVRQDGQEIGSALNAGEIDFSEITPDSNVFTFETSEIENVKFLDGTKEIVIALQIPVGIEMNTLSVIKNNIVVEGAPDDSAYDVSVEGPGIVTVCADSKDIADISSDDILGTVDLNGITISERKQNVPVRYTVKYSENCWVAGTYFVSIKTK